MRWWSIDAVGIAHHRVLFEENKGIIHSVTKDELILANYGSGSFTFYKRTQ